MNKWYMYIPKIRPEQWDVQTSLGFWDTNGSPNLGQTTRPYNYQPPPPKKRTCRIVDFAVLADHWVKLKVREKKNKYLDLARELKKLWNMKVTNSHRCAWYSHQRIGKRSGGNGNKRSSVEHPNYSTVKIGQNTEKSPGDLRRLDVTQTPLKKLSANAGMKKYKQTI